jgi:hypothetical protein
MSPTADTSAQWQPMCRMRMTIDIARGRDARTKLAEYTPYAAVRDMLNDAAPVQAFHAAACTQACQPCLAEITWAQMS